MKILILIFFIYQENMLFIVSVDMPKSNGMKIRKSPWVKESLTYPNEKKGYILYSKAKYLAKLKLMT